MLNNAINGNRQDASSPEPGGAVAPPQVLVAEDNRTNQLLLQRQLSVCGYTSKVVSDGMEALEEWQVGIYQLVLTDHQMPGMNGFELADAIRALEDPRSRHVPIIVLTANTMVTLSQKFTFSAVDAFLFKPVKMAVLKGMLQAWLPLEFSGIRSKQIDDPSRAAASAAIDLSVVRTFIGDDRDNQRQLLNKFIDDTPGLLSTLVDACHQQNAADVLGLSHTLKSSIRSVGANAMAKSILVLETLVAAGDWQAIKDRGDVLTALMDDFAVHARNMGY